MIQSVLVTESHRKNLLVHAKRKSLLARALKLPDFSLYSCSVSEGGVSVDFQRCPPSTGFMCFQQYPNEELVSFQGSSSSIKEMMKELLDAGEAGGENG